VPRLKYRPTTISNISTTAVLSASWGLAGVPAPVAEVEVETEEEEETDDEADDDEADLDDADFDSTIDSPPLPPALMSVATSP
jgi:hypothetical protein